MVLNSWTDRFQRRMLGRHLRAALQMAGAEVVAVSLSGAEDSVAWDL